MSSAPKISVYLITYNQAPFISKAIDSVLMQRISLEYEIVIGDDCSTDGTDQIIKNYQERWPNRIKPIFHAKNVGMLRNARDTLKNCQGEYIAFLEGDDYWTDPDKIRLQIEYLDNNSGCAICHHKVAHVGWPSGEIIREYPQPQYRVERATERAIAMTNFIQTCSAMVRRAWLPPLDEELMELKLGDWPLFALLSQHGWVGYIDRTMAHYRVHATNSWNNRPADYKLRAMEQMAWYLLARVGGDSKDLWRDTILALDLKDLALASKSLDIAKSIARLKKFISHSVEFRKPFWVANRLWPYYKANYVQG